MQHITCNNFQDLRRFLYPGTLCHLTLEGRLLPDSVDRKVPVWIDLMRLMVPDRANRFR